jgi:glycosyltransferase involved in cell wall biosynthesis
MRILWFTSTPSLAATKLNADSNMTGWVSSLEKAVSEERDIELGVAFPFGSDEPKTFILESTTYFSFPLSPVKGKYSGLLDRWRHTVEDGIEVSHYLHVIEKFKPDVIHVFGSESSFGEIVSHTNTPVAIQIQGNLSVCTLKYFAGISALQYAWFSNKKSFLLGYSTWHQFFTFRKRSLREQKILKNCKFIIGRTAWDRYISGIMAPESTYFHCDEVLRDPFYKSKWTKPQNIKFSIFSTLSGSTYKGFETILLAASFICKSGKIDFEWNIAGIEGSHEIISVTEKALSLKFAECNVVFRAALNADEIAAGLLATDCYVHPSHIENSPNSVCEAMLLGVPVIATYAGGTSSILQSGTDGILLQDGDPYALAGAILELAGSYEKSILLSTNARERALLRHNPSRIVKDLLSIYDNIINTGCK